MTIQYVSLETITEAAKIGDRKTYPINRIPRTGWIVEHEFYVEFYFFLGLSPARVWMPF